MANLIEKIKDKRAPAPETPERRDVPVAHPDPQQGLTSAQVRERADAGWTNAPVDPPGKTVKQIVLSNIFTYFNMLFFLLALCVIAVQQWLNLTFMGVIIVNTAIGIIQEIRSKKTLDKLSILASPKAVAVRDGRRVTVDTAQEFSLDEALVRLHGEDERRDADGHGAHERELRGAERVRQRGKEREKREAERENVLDQIKAGSAPDVVHHPPPFHDNRRHFIEIVIEQHKLCHMRSRLTA